MRLVLGGISGHRDLARDTGIVLKPEDCNAVADAIIRVFIENGDRTNRNKSRMKYVLDAWGFDKYLAAVEDKLGRKLDRVDAGARGAAQGPPTASPMSASTPRSSRASTGSAWSCRSAR